MRAHTWAGVDTKPYPLLDAWIKRIDSRPGTKKGLEVPSAGPARDESFAQQSYDEVKEWVKKADADIEEAKKEAK